MLKTNGIGLNKKLGIYISIVYTKFRILVASRIKYWNDDVIPIFKYT